MSSSSSPNTTAAFNALCDFISSLSEANKDQKDLRKYNILLDTVKKYVDEEEYSMQLGNMTVREHIQHHLELFCTCFQDNIGKDVLLKPKIENGDVDPSVTVLYTENIFVPLGAIINDKEEDRDTIRSHILNILVKWRSDEEIAGYLKQMLEEEKQTEAKKVDGSAAFLGDIINQVQSAVNQSKTADGSPPDLGTMISSVLGQILPSALSQAQNKMKSGELSKEGLIAGLPGLTTPFTETQENKDK